MAYADDAELSMAYFMRLHSSQTLDSLSLDLRGRCGATSLCESHMATTGDPQSIPLSCPSCLANRLLRLLQFLCLLILRPEQVGPLADWVVLVVSLTMLETQSSGNNITHIPSSKLYHFLTLPLLECHNTSRSPCTGAVD